MSTTPVPISSSPHRPSQWSTSPSLLRYFHRSSVSSLNSTGSAGYSGFTTGQSSTFSTGTGSFQIPSNIASPSPRPSSTNSTSGWSNLALLRKQSTGTGSMVYSGGEETTRSWTFVGFEWVVRDVAKLRDFIEGSPEPELSPEDNSNPNSPVAEDFDILKHSPVIGDGKFKLEIARNGSTASPDSLSLYITPLMLDFAHPTYEMSATMMAGIKCQDDRAGERGARADWAFEVWHDWVFRADNEVWECVLPSLSTLLENSRIRDTDSFVICVQIHCPMGPSLPAQPSVYYVPKDLLDGLEASLDNPNTGDIQFICLERPDPLSSFESPSPTPEVMSPITPVTRTRPSSSTSTSLSSSMSASISPFAPEMIARKRIIYAHSDILIHRSEYFATMLTSAFSENLANATGGTGNGSNGNGRKLFTIVVEEADFETIYWLLKYCYANWLLFKEVDDPRKAVEGVGRGWSVHGLHEHGGSEWDWKTFTKHGLPSDSGIGGVDTMSAVSGENFDESGQRSETTTTTNSTGPGPGKVKTLAPNAASQVRSPPASVSSRMSTGGATQNKGSSAMAGSSSSVGRRVGVGMNMSTTTAGGSTAPVRSKHIPIPVSTSSAPPPSSSYYPAPGPVSPHSQRARGPSSHPGSTNTVNPSPSPDPHPHPTPAPPPASALAMYQVAHRYAMPGLSSLALEHMMNTITPNSCFALLLATSVWDELRTLVEDYVVEKWDEVSVSEEFEVCCGEVAAGEWGPEGGKTLMALFRRLRSPGAMM